MGLYLTAAVDTQTFSTVYSVGTIVLMLALMYFIMLRPQRNEQKKKAQLMASLAVGDSVRTTGGFVGVILDISDDMVIVEFGNNKNCRIPMYKEAIVEVEKPEDAIVSANDSSDSKKK